MDTQRYAPHLAAAYDRGASQYRSDDEIEAQTENHRRLGGILRELCRSFSRPIRVLEIGCGTGRYFHWLENVSLLVGTDLSAEMLRRAEHPVREEEVTAKQIRLVQGNVYETEFAPESFDLVYSLGMFGYGAVWTQELCDKVHTWLAPGGRLFFNAIEVPHTHNAMHRFKETVKGGVYPRLPARWRARLQAREPVPIVRHTRGEVARIMEKAGFSDFSLSSYACRSPLWNGVHLECSARKDLVPLRERVDETSAETGLGAPAMAA